VLHVAAMTNSKICYGIEKAELPAKYAKIMEKEFIFWMNFFGKKYSNFKIYKADFAQPSPMNESVTKIINNAKLVFVNNYAFGAELNNQLKSRFCKMKENAFIISSEALCPLKSRKKSQINSRNFEDIGAIIDLGDLGPLNGNVSWKGKLQKFFVQRINRTLLEKYFAELKEKKLKTLVQAK